MPVNLDQWFCDTPVTKSPARVKPPQHRPEQPTDFIPQTFAEATRLDKWFFDLNALPLRMHRGGS